MSSSSMGKTSTERSSSSRVITRGAGCLSRCHHSTTDAMAERWPKSNITQNAQQVEVGKFRVEISGSRRAVENHASQIVPCSLLDPADKFVELFFRDHIRKSSCCAPDHRGQDGLGTAGRMPALLLPSPAGAAAAGTAPAEAAEPAAAPAETTPTAVAASAIPAPTAASPAE